MRRQAEVKTTGFDNRRIERQGLSSLSTDQKADVIVAAFGRSVLEQCRKLRREKQEIEGRKLG